MVIDLARQTLETHSMIPAEDRVLVAVSGGLDSIVLLDVLVRLSTELSFSIVVGHIDHGLRETASAQDALFVQDVARAYNVDALTDCLSSADLARGHKKGQEGAAREARLDALQTLALQVGASRIALGHTLDDQAETILHRLARGTGPTGLGGMHPVRLPFIRPLFATSRSALHAYALENGLTWREDASNDDLAFTRNRIRHRILPELQAINPHVCEALCRMAELTTELDEAAAFLVKEKLAQLQAESDDAAFTLRRYEVASLPRSLGQLILREAIRRSRGHLEGIAFTHIDAIWRLAAGPGTHGELSLPGLHVRMQHDALAFRVDPPAKPTHWDVPVDLGETTLPDGSTSLQLQVVAAGDCSLNLDDPWVECADADRIQFPLCLRTRLPGDRFSPLGVGHEMKLKDFLINEHTLPFHRDELPLLCDSHGIVWVVGMRLSDTVKLSERTQRVLMMRMKGVT